MALRQRFDRLLAVTTEPRVSPVSWPALAITVTLMLAGVIASAADDFVLTTLPNIWLLVVGVIVLDAATRWMPSYRIVRATQTFMYGFIYLAVTCVCGVLCAYALQRLAFPLQDRHLAAADAALGFDWLAFAHWVDRHPQIALILRRAYDTIPLQIALPVVLLAFADSIDELRVYILAFAVAFAATIVMSALMPAAGPIAAIDRSSFEVLAFTGATPVDHLTLLRKPGAFVMTENPGGIATFPSFHATVAVLTVLAIRRFDRIVAGLVVLNAAMLVGTITEGAHYLVDVIAGSAMAVVAYLVATQMIGVGESVAADQTRCVPDAVQHEVVHRRAGTIPGSELATVPVQQCSVSRCTAPGTST
jgi:membrane-associated phospholipid phosphatase